MSINSRIIVPLPPKGTRYINDYETYFKDLVSLQTLASVVLMTTYFMESIDADSVLTETTAFWANRFSQVYPDMTRDDWLRCQKVLEEVLGEIKKFYQDQPFLEGYLKKAARTCLTFTPELVFGDNESFRLALGDVSQPVVTETITPHWSYDTIRVTINNKPHREPESFD